MRYAALTVLFVARPLALSQERSRVRAVGAERKSWVFSQIARLERPYRLRRRCKLKQAIQSEGMRAAVLLLHVKEQVYEKCWYIRVFLIFGQGLS